MGDTSGCSPPRRADRAMSSRATSARRLRPPASPRHRACPPPEIGQARAWWRRRRGGNESPLFPSVADLGWQPQARGSRSRRTHGRDTCMAVEIGDVAPDFELPDQHGTPVKLSGFRGVKNVVLVFYPLAFSPVCSGELCALREDFPEVDSGDVELLTVSVDSLFTHRAWADAEHFQFSLLADFWPHGAVAKEYGVFDEAKGLATRGTFVIDKEGIVRWSVVNPIPQARDIADYQKALAALA